MTTIFSLTMVLFSCQTVEQQTTVEAADAAEAPAAEGRLPSNPEDQLKLRGEVTMGERTWTPGDCQMGSHQGMTGFVFMNEPDGLAMAVWTDGVPEGQSNVWIADRANPPADGDYSAGTKPCGKAKHNEGDEFLNGVARVSCGDEVEAELQFRNCRNALAGSAAASASGWPGF